MAEAFPLHWPEGWPRTKTPQRSRFDATMADARDGLFAEIHRMGGSYPVLSSNLELRRDGLPYAVQREPNDAGVAVYFMRKGKQMVFACDRWDRARDNMRAIAKTIEAMRGIERWGASDMMERAFSAFIALPAGGTRSWREVLGILPDVQVTKDVVETFYRQRAKKAHPDTGGSTEAMAELNAARAAALKEMG
jgi:hypothetical protein